MTNHTYWNLSGDFKIKNVRTHRLKLECDKYLEQDRDQIPTGELKDVKDTPFDFRGGENAPLLITSLERLDGGIVHAGENGIDDQFIINRPEKTYGDNILRDCARLLHHSTGRELKISTTQNCVVVYTANFLPKTGKDPADHHTQYSSICLETTNFNNAVNFIGKEGWPEEKHVLFRAGETYQQATLHEFIQK